MCQISFLRLFFYVFGCFSIIVTPILPLHYSPFLHFVSTLVLVQVFLHLLAFCLFYWFSLTTYVLKKLVYGGNISLWGKLKLFLLIQLERQMCLDIAFCAALSPWPCLTTSSWLCVHGPGKGESCGCWRRVGEWEGDLCPSSLTFPFRLLAGALCWLWLVCIFHLPHNVRGQREDTDVSAAIFMSSCFRISLATKTAFISKNL